jgi:hypothetical protein
VALWEAMRTAIVAGTEPRALAVVLTDGLAMAVRANVSEEQRDVVANYIILQLVSRFRSLGLISQRSSPL